jgi:hypothetical protein
MELKQELNPPIYHQVCKKTILLTETVCIASQF